MSGDSSERPAALNAATGLILQAAAQSDLIDWISIDESIETVLNASRDPSQLTLVNDGRSYQALLNLLTKITSRSIKCSDPAYQNLLRCICNLAADNDINRQTAIDNQALLETLETQLQNAPEIDTLDINIAIATLYNICKDFEPAQKACASAGLHHVLLSAVHCLLARATELGQLGIAVDLWHDVAAAGDEHGLASLGPTELSRLLSLAHIEISDDDDHELSLEIMSVVALYLAKPPIQLAVLTHDKLTEVLHLLELATFRRKARAIHAGRASEPATADSFSWNIERALLKCLTDISQLSEYPQLVASDDLLPVLYTEWLDPGACLEHVSLTVCAFTLLANLATNDASAINIAASVDMPRIFNFMLDKLGRVTSNPKTVLDQIAGSSPAEHKTSPARPTTSLPAEKEYLYMATKFIHQMAGPPSARSKLFYKEELPLEVVARLMSYPDKQVSLAAYELYNRILDAGANGPNPVLLLTKQSGEVGGSTMVDLWMLHRTMRAAQSDDSDISISLEIGLLNITWLRICQRTLASSDLISSHVSDFLHHEFAESMGPVLFLAKQSSVPKYWIQGWLGLVLIAQTPRGPSLIQEQAMTPIDGPEGSRISSLPVVQELEKHILQHMDTSTDSEAVVAEKEPGPSEERIPPEVKVKARDNAIILLVTLLQSKDVHGEFRTQLEGIARRASITISSSVAGQQ